MSENKLQWKSLEQKTTAVDEEFNNFMVKVEEVKKLMEGLASKDKIISKNSLKLVDDYLGDTNNHVGDLGEDSIRVKTCKTVVNQKAFDNMTNDSKQQETHQSPEDFMKNFEEDAKRRAEERRLQIEASDTLKKMAISAFNKGEYERALSNYNKAINEFRGSSHLYTSRALTCLKLKLYKRTIEDCELVLRCFNEKSLKALLYKAKAHQALEEPEEANKCVNEAVKHHPKCEEDIHDYMNDELQGSNN